MNRKNFIKTSTGLVAASALPFSSHAKPEPSAGRAEKKVMLKKSLTFGMIKEELSLEDKFKLVKDLGQCACDFNSIVGNEHPKIQDKAEFCFHIHALQNMVLSQAAARAYPDEYRLLGKTCVVNKEDKGGE